MHALSKLTYQASPYKVLGISSGNTLRRIVDPGSVAAQKIGEGAPANTRTLLDPGGEVIPTPPAAAVLPGPVTIDKASRQEGATDRLRRRRGVLANIYSGGSLSSGASVGTARLLGGG